MRRRSTLPVALVATLAVGGLAVFASCDAGGGGGTEAAGVGPSGSGGGGPGAGGSDAGGNTAVSTAVSVTVTTGSEGSSSSGVINPCGTECIDTELCDGANKGLDDNCNGEVDEGCPCSPGQATDCFRGDPSYRTAPGCFPGSMRCNEFGQWGVCDGGAHAFGPEPCQEGSLEGCHPITAVPFQVVELREGTGVFGQGADAGSEVFAVGCPADVTPCPAVNGSTFQPLQSGEYTVTYSKEVGGSPETCSFPLFVGARGLRVELTWNHQGSTNADYDLHMLQPGSILGFTTGGTNSDCGYSNCLLGSIVDDEGPVWFPESAPAGDPVQWYLDPTFELNSCYFAPRGVGAAWQARGEGCHNPRLDLDNVSCDPSETNTNSGDFCAPENINVDFPPSGMWTRIGVHYFTFTSDNNYAVRPNVKIFCDGALAADLGNAGFYAPERPVEQNLSDQGTMWVVADVYFKEPEDECGDRECVVAPIYRDAGQRTPYFLDGSSSYPFEPEYPPAP